MPNAYRPRIKSAILSAHPKFVRYAPLDTVLSPGSPIDGRIFPDDRRADTQWLDVPLELISVESRQQDALSPNRSAITKDMLSQQQQFQRANRFI
jgi:hypothetical protein